MGMEEKETMFHNWKWDISRLILREAFKILLHSVFLPCIPQLLNNFLEWMWYLLILYFLVGNIKEHKIICHTCWIVGGDLMNATARTEMRGDACIISHEERRENEGSLKPYSGSIIVRRKCFSFLVYNKLAPASYFILMGSLAF